MQRSKWDDIMSKSAEGVDWRCNPDTESYAWERRLEGAPATANGLKECLHSTFGFIAM